MPAESSQKKDPVLLICSPYLALTEAPSIWEAAAGSGVDSVELLVDPDLSCPDLQGGGGMQSHIRTEGASRDLGKEAKDYGISIEVLAAPLLLRQGMTEAPSWTEKLLDNAGASGAGMVSFPLVTDNFLVPEIADEKYLDSARRIFASLVEASRAAGVKILFENLSVYLNRSEILSPLLSDFSKDELGFCLDPVNLAWYGHPLHEIYRICSELASRSTGLHVKNIKYPPGKNQNQRKPGWRYDELAVPAQKGDLDFKRLIWEFREAGFSGYYGIEDDSLPLVPPAGRLDILRESTKFVSAQLARKSHQLSPQPQI